MTEEKKSVKLPSAPTIEELTKVKAATEVRAMPAPKKDKGKEPEPLFGKNIRDAIQSIKGLLRD